MNLNWAVVKIFGFLIGTMHLVMVVFLLFALYAKSDPETAGEIIGNINWMNLLNPSFEFADSTRQCNFTHGMKREAAMPKCFSPSKVKEHECEPTTASLRVSVTKFMH